MKICGKCDTPMGDLAGFCSKCGMKLPLSSAQVELAEEDEFHRRIICGETGHAFQIALGSENGFCSKCGEPLQPPITFH